jgi:hypothetical protein
VQAPPVAAGTGESRDATFKRINELVYDSVSDKAEAKREIELLLDGKADEIKWSGSVSNSARRHVIRGVLWNDSGEFFYADRNCEQLERELRARGDTPLIRMAADRVLSAYVSGAARESLEIQAFGYEEETPDFGSTQLECHQSFLTALEALKVAESLEKPAISGERAQFAPLN